MCAAVGIMHCAGGGAPECLMSRRMDDLEEKLNAGTLDDIYCSQCMSSTHEKGIFTHLNDHHD